MFLLVYRYICISVLLMRLVLISAAAVWRGWMRDCWAQDWRDCGEGKQRRLQNTHSRSDATSLQIFLWWRVYIWQSVDTEGTWPGTSLWQGLLWFPLATIVALVVQNLHRFILHANMVYC